MTNKPKPVVDGIKVDHVIDGPPYHSMWDNALPPVLEIDSGETVLFRCIEATGGQYSENSTAEDVRHIDLSRLHTITGPVFVRGATPADTLRVDILGIEPAKWGWTSVEPNFGILADRFGAEYALRIWHVDVQGIARFRPDVGVPIEPFCGIMGVAPREPGAIITIPPRAIGGNMDSKHLRAGATAYFPIQVPGALFSLGDGHLAQGDGEVCGTAIEASMAVTVRISIVKNRTIPAVRYETPAGVSPIDSAGHFVTTAAGLDLHRLARDAVNGMVDLLTAEFDLSPMDAYVLCSVAGNLKIAVPVLGARHAGFVTFHMPRSIFAQTLRRRPS
ncbi:MAG TPA: acetamidase/formamidase family protein [Bauldia sp.]|nr:acetamidase/formamidase family protein [Bauldia sp.]